MRGISVASGRDTPCTRMSSFFSLKVWLPGQILVFRIFFLKLIFTYFRYPEPYFNIDEVENHPTMPKNLKHHIRKTWEENCKDSTGKWGDGTSYVDRCPQLNMVWLHCDGETDADKENIGSVSYTPWRGFPAHFFPYFNQLGYLQPVVMVQLKNPTPGVLINIQCTAWAKGIEHNEKTMRGSVHLEFLMD